MWYDLMHETHSDTRPIAKKDLRSLLKDYTKVTRHDHVLFIAVMWAIWTLMYIYTCLYNRHYLWDIQTYTNNATLFIMKYKKQFGYSTIFLVGCQRWRPAVYHNPQWIIGYLPGFSLLFTHLKTKSIELIGKSSSMPKGISFHWSSCKVWKTIESYLRCIFMYQWNPQHYYPCIHSTGLRNVLNEWKSSQKVYMQCRTVWGTT